MNIFKKTKTLQIIILILMLTAALLMASFLLVSGQAKFESTPYMYFRPNPIGVNQDLLVNAWIVPRPPGGEFGEQGEVFHDYHFIFTKPDGTTQTITIPDSFRDGTVWFNYKPDQVGAWTVQFTWDGDATHTVASTEKMSLTVQQDPIPSWPPAPLPTQQWTFPINPENREWAYISGPYLQPTGGTGLGYDGTGQRFNPYSQGPNTAHILWKIPPASGVGGLVGGQYGELLTYSGSAPSVNVVMAGRGYWSANNVIHCVDMRTGKELWTAPGSYTVGTVTDTATITRVITGAEMTSTTTTFSPTLLSIGNRLIKYDGITGKVTLNMTAIDGTVAYLAYDGQYAYVSQRSPSAKPFAISPENYADPGPFNLIKLDTGGYETDLAKRIIYNVTYPFNQMDFGICLYNDILALIHFPLYGDSGAVNTTTGEVLWRRPIGGAQGYIEQKPESVTSANGVMFFAVENMKFEAVDMRTGEVLWHSEQAEAPWGNFWAYGQSTAYGNVYALAYNGVYAFDQATGKINWHNPGPKDNNSETPYGGWPFGSADPIVADGKVYAPATEHSPTFYYRGQTLQCMDANSGSPIWDIMGYYTVPAIAEGSLLATNAYDLNAYCFSKGPTNITIITSHDIAPQGTVIQIKGTITDQSPAQPNTPAISDESMSDWMEYLHMQQPKPTSATGVPVTIKATAFDGTSIDIATVTSDINGNFATTWVLPAEGTYSVSALFDGSESYWQSEAQTIVSVIPTQSTTLAPTGSPSAVPEPQALPTNSIYVAVAAAVVIIAIIFAAAFIRKRK